MGFYLVPSLGTVGKGWRDHVGGLRTSGLHLSLEGIIMLLPKPAVSLSDLSSGAAVVYQEWGISVSTDKGTFAVSRRNSRSPQRRTLHRGLVVGQLISDEATKTKRSRETPLLIDAFESRSPLLCQGLVCLVGCLAASISAECGRASEQMLPMLLLDHILSFFQTLSRSPRAESSK